MKSLPKIMSFLVILMLVYIVSTGISLHAFTGIEDGIIKGSLNDNYVFETIDRAKYITIGANLLTTVLAFLFLWRTNFQTNNSHS